MQPEKLMKFREISRLWHRFLEGSQREQKESKTRPKQEKEGRQERKTKKDEASVSSRKRARSTTGKEVKVKRTSSSPPMAKRVKRALSTVVATEDISEGLKRLLGRTATWRIPEQGEAMTQVMAMRGNETLTVVLPTGAGKSVLFMLPALVEEWGTTVVIVPFAALMDDLVERAC